MGAVLTVSMQDNDITYGNGTHPGRKRAVRPVMKVEDVIQRQTAAQHTPVHKLVICCVHTVFGVFVIQKHIITWTAAGDLVNFIGVYYIFRNRMCRRVGDAIFTAKFCKLTDVQHAAVPQCKMVAIQICLAGDSLGGTIRVLEKQLCTIRKGE